jgi:hypothetical protein
MHDTPSAAPSPSPRDLALSHLTSAFDVPTVDARRRVGERLMVYLEPRRRAVDPQTWGKVASGIERAVATGRCDALIAGIDAIEAQRLAAAAVRVCRSVV